MGDTETRAGVREVKLKTAENGVMRGVVFVYQQEHVWQRDSDHGWALPPPLGGFPGGPV